MDLTRRHFALMGALGFGAACAPRAGDAPAPTTADRIAAAENLLGVEYTEAERAVIAESLEDGRASLQALRDFDKPNSLSPALTFDPRLPGVDYRYAAPSDPTILPSIPPYQTPDVDPSDDTALAFASVHTLSRLLESGAITSERLTRLYLDRIAAFDPQLEAFITPMPELALDQAREADRRRAAGETGPLLGVPYAAKDLFDTAGIRTTYGAEPFKTRIATEDAWVVTRLREAGAVLLGKTTLGALAYGDIWFGGRTNNPWNPAEGSSGSSAGSASAVGAGLCAFALGTETLGSLVSPSTRCGVASLRPTFGRVPRTGAMALCWSMDKIGPITRHVADTALIAKTIYGADSDTVGGDPASIPNRYDRLARGTDLAGLDVRGLRVGVDPSWLEDADPGQRAALEALKTIATVVELDLPPPDLPVGALSYILLSEAAAAFEMLTLDGRDDSLTWQAPAAWPATFRAARFTTAIDLIQADRIRRLAMQHMHDVFRDNGLDALFSPPFAGGLLSITNYTGHPCATIRTGFSDQPNRTLFDDSADDGPLTRVPNSAVLWGDLFGDETIVHIASALESRLGVAAERPPIFG